MSKQSYISEIELPQQTAKFFETLLRASADGIVITDATRSVVLVNEAFCDFLGRWPSDVIKTSLFVWLEQFQPDAAYRWAELERRVYQEGTCRDVEFQTTTPDGRRHLSVNASLFERVDDEERGVIISIWRDVTKHKRAEEELRQHRDHLENLVEARTVELERTNEGLRREIADRKRAEKALRESEGRFRNLFDGISDGVAVYKAVDNGADFVFLDYNPAGQKMDCVSKQDAVGRRVTEVFPGVAEFGLLDALRRVWKTRISEDCPVSVYEDERVTFWRKNSVYRLPSGEIVAVYSDETERKQAEQEWERLIAELEAKNAELERFTYTVSHDLRSPLVTISGFLGMLKQDAETGNTQAIKEDVTFISNAARKMEQLLDELLDLSRIGRLVNPPSEISLADLAKEVVSTTSKRLLERDIRVEISPGLPVVLGDRLRLWEVLQNLVDNAVNFMGDQPDARIEIGCRRDAEETVCYVRDNGMGIDSAYHEKVFDLFDQLGPESEGTGVGLAIVKRVVEVHGGRIWVESEGPGQGSTFCFTIPRKEGGNEP